MLELSVLLEQVQLNYLDYRVDFVLFSTLNQVACSSSGLQTQ